MYPLHFSIGDLDSGNSGNLILHGNNWLDPNALMLFLRKKHLNFRKFYSVLEKTLEILVT